MSNTKNAFDTDLLQLQNLIKRDPTSYRDEVINNFCQLFPIIISSYSLVSPTIS